jgi:hypothetical protein
MEKALLEELQNIVNADTEQITQRSTNRLLLASMVSLVSVVNDMHCKIDSLTMSMGEHVSIDSDQFEDCERMFATVEEVKKLQTNLAIRAGQFVAERPKTAVVIFVVAVILANAWFVSDYRHLIFHLLGLPTTLLQAP